MARLRCCYILPNAPYSYQDLPQSRVCPITRHCSAIDNRSSTKLHCLSLSTTALIKGISSCRSRLSLNDNAQLQELFSFFASLFYQAFDFRRKLLRIFKRGSQILKSSIRSRSCPNQPVTVLNKTFSQLSTIFQPLCRQKASIFDFPDPCFVCNLTQPLNCISIS